MNDLFNILIFSKDYNQGVIIQDYIKAIGYNSQVFDQEEAAYEGYQPQRKKEVRTYIFGKFKFDLQKQILSIEGKTTKLTTKEADLLTLLCQHANNMVDRMHALQIIWRSDNYFSARSMDVYITKLRKLLQDDPTIKIINVHGKGYKLSTRENDN